MSVNLKHGYVRFIQVNRCTVLLKLSSLKLLLLSDTKIIQMKIPVNVCNIKYI